MNSTQDTQYGIQGTQDDCAARMAALEARMADVELIMVAHKVALTDLGAQIRACLGGIREINQALHQQLAPAPQIELI